MLATFARAASAAAAAAEADASMVFPNERGVSGRSAMAPRGERGACMSDNPGDDPAGLSTAGGPDGESGGGATMGGGVGGDGLVGDCLVFSIGARCIAA